jgi:MerR family copper efflux transcriptional regulator
MQIGEAADRVGLSIRTLRHYEEVGLVPPSARSEGGFRLYTETDLERLALVKPMKPLGFTLEQMCELLEVMDTLRSGEADDRRVAQARDQLTTYRALVASRVQTLRDQLHGAEAFARTLEDHQGATP